MSTEDNKARPGTRDRYVVMAAIGIPIFLLLLLALVIVELRVFSRMLCLQNAPEDQSPFGALSCKLFWAFPSASSSEKTTEQWAQDFETGPPAVQLRAVMALGKICDARSVPIIVRADADDLLFYPTHEFVFNCIGPAQAGAVPELIPMLNSDDYYLLRSAAMALGRMGPAAKDAIPALQEITKGKDSDPYVLDALREIQGLP